MFLTDWFCRALASLGLWQKEAKILLLGARSEAKIAFLSWLGDEAIDQPDPDLALPTLVELSIENINFKLFDFVNCQTARRALGDYHLKVDAVVYVLPSPRDLEHLQVVLDIFEFESPGELPELLSDEALANVPLLILQEHHLELPLHHWERMMGVILAQPNVRVVEVSRWEPCSSRDVFNWLSQHIQ